MRDTVNSWFPPCKHSRHQAELTHSPGGYKFLCLHNSLKKPCLQRGPLIRQQVLEALLVELAEE